MQNRNKLVHKVCRSWNVRPSTFSCVGPPQHNMPPVFKTQSCDRFVVLDLSASSSECGGVPDCRAASSPLRSPDSNFCSDHHVTQDMLTGEIWLSISQLNWECTCHSLLDKLWLAPVYQASELWKPLMDEIWTSIFLSSRLLNKLLLKFTAMFADMCFRECSCLPAFPPHELSSREENNLGGKQNELQGEHEDILGPLSGLMRGLSCWAHKAWRRWKGKLIVQWFVLLYINKRSHGALKLPWMRNPRLFILTLFMVCGVVILPHGRGNFSSFTGNEWGCIFFFSYPESP